MRRFPVLLFALLAFFASSAIEAKGNAERGKALAEKKGESGQACATCHGADGSKPDTVEKPILAGQYPDYIYKALSDYKSGKRVSAVMKPLAETLSKQDMEDLAAWFSSQKSNLHFQR